MARKITSENLVLNIIINGDKGKKEIIDLEKSVRILSSANSELSKKMSAIERGRTKLERAGKKESDAYKNLTAELKRLSTEFVKNEQSIEHAKSRMDALRSGLDLNKMSIAELRAEMNRLSKIRNLMLPGTESWNKTSKQLDEVTARFKQLRNQSVKTEMGFCQMASTVSSSVISMYAAVVAVFKPLGRLVESFARYTDVLSGARKTTGLTNDEINEMSDALAGIDTRTSQDNLMGLVRVAGKLGITGKRDIEGFVRAADQIVVALSEDLGGDVEEAINQVGKLVDVFHLKDTYGIEDAMLKVGSVINSLGAASTANEGYIVEFTKRVAGIAPMAGVTATDVMGLAATLDQFGQTAEVSSTVYSQMVMKMFQDTKTYARLAGMDVKDFSTLLNDDVNEAFIRVLDGMKGNNAGMQAVVDSMGEMGLEGKRAIGVLGVLSSNTETLRQQQELANREFEAGTSLTNEFGLMNNTAQAQVDKHRKRLVAMGRELGENLQPAYAAVLRAGGGFLNLLSPIAVFLTKNATAVAAAAAGMVFWAIKTNLATIANSRFILSLKSMWKWLAANPMMLVVGALAAVAAKMVEVAVKTDTVGKAMRRVEKAARDASGEFEGERVRLDRLFGALKAAKEGTAAYETAKKAIIDQYGEYLSGLDAEKRTLIDVKGAQDALTLSIRASAREKMYNKALGDAELKYGEKIATAYEKIQQKLERQFGAEKGASLFANLRNQLEGGHELTREMADILNVFNITQSTGTQSSTTNGVMTFVNVVRQAKSILNEETAAIAARLGKTDQELLAEQQATANQMAEQERKAAEERAKQQTEENRERLEQETENNDKAREAYLKGLIDSAKTEEQLYEDRLRKAGLFGKKREQLEGEALVAWDVLATEHAANLKKLADDRLKAAEVERKAYQDTLEQSLKDAIELTTKRQAMEMVAMRISHADQLLAFSGTAAERAALKKRFDDAELNQEKAHAKEMIAVIEGLFRDGFMLTASDYITFDELTDEQVAALKAQLATLKDKLLTNDSTPGEVKKEDRDVLGFSKSDWEGLFKNLNEGKLGIEDLQMAAGTLSKVWGNYNDMRAAQESKILKQYEDATKSKRAALDRQLDQGVISQEQYNARVSQLDDDMDAKREEMEKKQARRAKLLGIFESIINTGIAVTSALKVAPPMGLILAGVVGAMGAAQVATIAAQQYATGRYPVKGAKDGVTYNADYIGHPRTGVYDKPSLGLFSEKEPELVVDGATTRRLIFNYPELYNSILQLSRGGVPQYEEGRYVRTDKPAVVSETASRSGDTELKTLLKEAIKAAKDLQGMEVRIAMYGRGGLYKSLEQADQYFDKIRK